MKNHLDAVRSEEEAANHKLWAVCDLAMGLLLTKTTNFEMRDFPSEPRIPPMYFRKPADPNFVNGKREAAPGSGVGGKVGTGGYALVRVLFMPTSRHPCQYRFPESPCSSRSVSLAPPLSRRSPPGKLYLPPELQSLGKRGGLATSFSHSMINKRIQLAQQLRAQKDAAEGVQRELTVVVAEQTAEVSAGSPRSTGSCHAAWHRLLVSWRRAAPQFLSELVIGFSCLLSNGR